MSTLILAFLLALGTALFALQNTASVRITFLLWDYQTSLVLVIFGSAGAGVILALLASLGGRWKGSRTRRSLESTIHAQGERIRELEQQLRLAHESTRPPESDL
ncbi:MAG: LapA family protein [Nitrospira sp.]|nr:LapA family protein [Nitrospira sp.]MDH4303428.1 LapA family protein [Nitrospira sp.]MDH5192105.1 LapA family protein [Nitrospira sp.]